MFLLRFISQCIDALNRFLGKISLVAIFLAALVSAGNAIIRHLFNWSSNGLLEAQWYLFAIVFLLASGYTYLEDKHIRIDIIASKFSEKTQAYLEIFGIIFFLFPAFSILLYVSIEPALRSWEIWEMSNSYGGLPRAPIKMLIPIGIGFLLLQGISEFCKRIIRIIEINQTAKQATNKKEV